MKVTQWFNGKTKPKHKGWYECLFFGTEFFYSMMLYWNGRRWVQEKNSKFGSSFGYIGDKWRGLAEKTK